MHMNTEDMDAVRELNSDWTRSLDRKATRKRRSVKKLYNNVALGFGLLCILQVTLNVSLRLLMHKEAPNCNCTEAANHTAKVNVDVMHKEAPNCAGTANRTAKVNVNGACELTLDPNTANRHLSLSEDKKTVTYVEEEQSYPDDPERFDSQYQVLCREGLTGRCYWEVESNGNVDIGVTYRGITRRGDESWLGWNNKSWSLYYMNGTYSATYNSGGKMIRGYSGTNQRVRVSVDRPAGTLSFYRVCPGVGGYSDKLKHIHTFHIRFTQEDLLPAFGLESGSSVSLSQSPGCETRTEGPVQVL